MRLAIAALVAASSWSTATAQTTWIDDDGGAGVHSTPLPAALAATASGDTLLVAPVMALGERP